MISSAAAEIYSFDYIIRRLYLEFYTREASTGSRRSLRWIARRLRRCDTTPAFMQLNRLPVRSGDFFGNAALTLKISRAHWPLWTSASVRALIRGILSRETCWHVTHVDSFRWALFSMRCSGCVKHSTDWLPLGSEARPRLWNLLELMWELIFFTDISDRLRLRCFSRDVWRAF